MGSWSHHFRFLKLLIHVLVKSAQRPPQHKTDKQSRRKEQEKLQSVDKVIVLIKSGDRFTHGIDGVGEGEEQVCLLEEAGEQLYGVRAAGACYLHYHDDDEYRLADVAEGDGEGVRQHGAGQ